MCRRLLASETARCGLAKLLIGSPTAISSELCRTLLTRNCYDVATSRAARWQQRLHPRPPPLYGPARPLEPFRSVMWRTRSSRYRRCRPPLDLPLCANDDETPAPASLDLGTGERHRGYAQHKWPNRTDDRQSHWRDDRPGLRIAPPTRPAVQRHRRRRNAGRLAADGNARARGSAAKW
jgi:hypothetical protein